MAKSLADLSAERGFIDEATAQEHNKADEQAASEEMPIEENAHEVQDNTESKTESEQAASGDAQYSAEEAEEIEAMAEQLKRDGKEDFIPLISSEKLEMTIKQLTALMQSDVFAAIKENVQTVEEYYKKAFGEKMQSDMEAASKILNELRPFLQAEIDELNAKEGNTTPISIHDVQSCMTVYGEPISPKDGKPEDNPFFDLIERAKKHKAAADEARKITKLAEMLKSGAIPKKQLMPNNALINHLQDRPAINAGEHDLTVANKKKNRPEIIAVVQIDYDEKETGIKLTTPKMTEYERQVTNAICTLWRYGHDSHTFTSDMIYRTMTGQGSGGKATKGQKSAITRFMHKWEGVKITIDFTDEAKKRKYEIDGNPVDGLYKKRRFLEFDETLVIAGGETMTAWEFTRKPVILEYSELSGQLLPVELEMFDIKRIKQGKVTTESISNSEDRIAVKGYLVRQIAIMKDRKYKKVEWQSVVLFDTVFEKTGLQDADRDKRSKMFAYIRQCLDYWKANGKIANYRIIKAGKKITGVDITL
jgi:hypothetical protein